MRIIVRDGYEGMSDEALRVFMDGFGKSRVVGFATGNTPKLLYSMISEECLSGRISFKDKISFNLDEYYPIRKTDPECYRYYMEENLFKNIDIDRENINFPDSELDEKDAVRSYSEAYNKKGPIDLQILGIGQNGHIGFNEPGSGRDSTIRVVSLTESTIIRNKTTAKRAITMGIKEILESRRIVILASGSDKSGAVRLAIKEDVTPEVPGSFLQEHDDVTFIIDNDAASLL